MEDSHLIADRLQIADNGYNDPALARTRSYEMAIAPSVPLDPSTYPGTYPIPSTMPQRDSGDHYAYPIETPIQFTEQDLLPKRDPLAVRMGVVLVAVVLIFATLGFMLVAFGEGDATTAASPDEASTLELGPDGVPNADQAGALNQALAGGFVSDAGAITPIFTPEVMRWGNHIQRWASEAGVDPNHAAIIMQIESCGDPAAGSPAGAQGLFQVMPYHFTAGEDMLDPDTNARRGMNYFADRLEQTNGDVGRAFAGYNGGHGAAGSPYNTWAAETQRYFYWATGILQDIESGAQQSGRLQEWLDAGGSSLCRQAAQRPGVDALLTQ